MILGISKSPFITPLSPITLGSSGAVSSRSTRDDAEESEVEEGEGLVVLFVHGFPEFWYSWHHQILALFALGYRCVAPDMRGYGDTDAPADASKYTYSKIFFITWALTASTIRAKMLYATFKDGIRRALEGIYYELHATDLMSS